MPDRTLRLRPLAHAILALVFLAAPGRLRAADPLVGVRSLLLPGVAGRIDHLAIDTRRGHLFVAALGNDTVEILDRESGKRRAPLAVERPTGIAYAQSQDRIVVASSGEGALVEYDGESGALLAKLSGLPDADNVRLAPDGRLAYVGYGDDALAVVDLATNRRLADIPLGSHPESFQLEERGHRLFVNLPQARAIWAIDRGAPAERASWSLGSRRGNYSMALDEGRSRLFVAFREPARLAALDSSSGALQSELATCENADDAFYDARRGRLYVSCGAGVLDVLDASGTSLRPLARLRTRPGARTALFSPADAELYVAAPRRDARDAEILVYRAQP